MSMPYCRRQNNLKIASECPLPVHVRSMFAFLAVVVRNAVTTTLSQRKRVHREHLAALVASPPSLFISHPAGTDLFGTGSLVFLGLLEHPFQLAGLPQLRRTSLQLLHVQVLRQGSSCQNSGRISAGKCNSWPEMLPFVGPIKLEPQAEGPQHHQDLQNNPVMCHRWTAAECHSLQVSTRAKHPPPGKDKIDPEAPYRCLLLEKKGNK